MDIEEKIVPDQMIAVIKHKGPLSDIGVLTARLLGWVETEEIETAGDVFAIYYNNIKRFKDADDVVYDLGIPIADGQEIDDTPLLSVEKLIEHMVLSAVHNGPLDNIRAIYEEIAEFADENHYDIIGSPQENYIKSIYDVENPEDMDFLNLQIELKYNSNKDLPEKFLDSREKAATDYVWKWLNDSELDFDYECGGDGDEGPIASYRIYARDEDF